MEIQDRTWKLLTTAGWVPQVGHPSLVAKAQAKSKRCC